MPICAKFKEVMNKKALLVLYINVLFGIRLQTFTDNQRIRVANYRDTSQFEWIEGALKWKSKSSCMPQKENGND